MASEWQRMVDGLRAADETVAAQFYDRYRPLLERIAARNLQSGMRRRVAADEVAHSACRTFLRRVDRGEFDLGERERMWTLLCAITVAKAREQARFHLAERRAIGREAAVGGSTDEDERTLESFLVSDEALPDEVVADVDEVEHVLQQLDEDERRIVEMRLEQRTQVEIAAAMRKSERTVRRMMERIEARLMTLLEG